MVFGEQLRPAPADDSARWLLRSCRTSDWTVGTLVPNQYEAVARVWAPEPADEWWPSYMNLFQVVTSIGERHTSEPASALFAIWDGHGYSMPAPDTPGAGTLTTLDLPGRRYYLFEGPLSAIDTVRYPGWDEWHNPDLVWPADRRWFVATDVDFWSLYIAGSAEFVAEVCAAVPTRAEAVALDLPLEYEN